MLHDDEDHTKQESAPSLIDLSQLSSDRNLINKERGLLETMRTATWTRLGLMVVGSICLSLLPSSLVLVEGAGYMDQQTYSTQGAVQKVRRERNLDHWDSDTLAYYLDQLNNSPEDKLGYDAAVMFYAQWDSNSHALAPYWDRIANILEAGTSDSRLIMALFDCELNQAHAQLCEAVGITHYPTLLFLGSGPYHDTDPFTKTLFGAKSAGVMGPAPIANTVKFQGNWQYYDSILDWIRTMQALSNWHTWSTQGLGKRLRNLIFPSVGGRSGTKSLPVGIPGGRLASVPPGESVSSQPSTLGSTQNAELEFQVKQLGELNNEYEKMILRSSNMMDSLLTGSNADVDMFALLNTEDAWVNPNKVPTSDILRHCVAELSLDYCQRVSQQVANEMVEDLVKEGKSVEELFAMSNLEDEILKRVERKEPYCAVLDNCIVSDFTEDICTPQTCPFVNPTACLYLSSCLDPSLQQEYAEALGVSAQDTGDETESPRKTWGL